MSRNLENTTINGNALRRRYSSTRDETDFRFVQIVVGFMRIGEIDTLNEKYQAEVQIEAKWIDNDQQVSEYDPNKHWNVMG